MNIITKPNWWTKSCSYLLAIMSVVIFITIFLFLQNLQESLNQAETTTQQEIVVPQETQALNVSENIAFYYDCLEKIRTDASLSMEEVRDTVALAVLIRESIWDLVIVGGYNKREFDETDEILGQFLRDTLHFYGT